MLASNGAWEGWLAGIIEGEGSIHIRQRLTHRARRETFTVRVHVGNTSQALVEKVAEIAGVGTVRLGRPSTNGWRAMYLWAVEGAYAAAVLERVLPLLVSKREQARLALRVHEINQCYFGRDSKPPREADEARHIARVTCSALNKGGPVDLDDVWRQIGSPVHGKLPNTDGIIARF